MDHNYYLVLPNFVCCHFYGDGVRTKKKETYRCETAKRVTKLEKSYHNFF